jgi:serpin B
MPRRWPDLRLVGGLLATMNLAAQPAPRSDFGARLVAELAVERPRENIFVSPASIAMALGMAELAASDPARNAIRQTLHASSSELAGMSRDLRARKGVDLSVANAVWSDLRIPLSPDFISRAKSLFAAEARTLDFQDPRAADVLNAWVRRETRDKIDGIVNRQIVAASRMILTNAVYFRGRWVDPFKKNLTHPGPFHRAAGGDRQVPFMHAPMLRDSYLTGPGFECAVLPYSPEVQLYLLLPDPGTRPETLLAKLETAGAHPDVDLELKLPKFTLNYDASLGQVLRRLGMERAFDVAPNFFIGEVLHRSRLEIDEEGTVAAAVTAVMAPTGIAPPRTRVKKTMLVDRPFALVIRDLPTRATLFAGVIYDPAVQ